MDHIHDRTIMNVDCYEEVCCEQVSHCTNLVYKCNEKMLWQGIFLHTLYAL